MAKVSVIIPVYNTEKYLRRCLDSVCNQTLRDIEIICINDCSTDNSLSILEEYAGNDNRIKLIDFKENKGAAVARNTGIDMAECEYIGFVDSDDFVDLDFYEKLYTKAVETNFDMVIGNIRYYHELEKIFTTSDFISKVNLNKLYFNVNFTTAIYRKQLLQKNKIYFTINSSFGEDRELPIKSTLLSNNLAIVNNVFYTYVRHKMSATGTTFSAIKAEGLFLAWKRIFLFLSSIDLANDDYNLLLSVLIDEYCDILATQQDKLFELLSDNFVELYSIIIQRISIKNNHYNKIYQLAKQSKYKELQKFLLFFKCKTSIEKTRKIYKKEK